MNPSNSTEPVRTHEPNQPAGDRLPVDESDSDAPGISPQNPSSMPRAEDDPTTHARSPEFHDQTAPDSPLEEEPTQRHSWE